MGASDFPSLAGEVALVTGGSRGIGRAIAIGADLERAEDREDLVPRAIAAAGFRVLSPDGSRELPPAVAPAASHPNIVASGE